MDKLKTNGDSSNKITEKVFKSDSENLDDTKESVLEIFRTHTDLSIGQTEELDWATSRIDILVRDMPIELDMKVLEDAKIFADRIKNTTPPKEQITNCLRGTSRRILRCRRDCILIFCQFRIPENFPVSCIKGL